MSNLIKKICALANKLNDLSDSPKAKEERKRILELFLKVPDKFDNIAHKEFGENDDLYLDAVEKIKYKDWVLHEINDWLTFNEK